MVGIASTMGKKRMSIGRFTCAAAPAGAALPMNTVVETRPDITMPLTAGFESASTTMKSASDNASTTPYPDLARPRG